MAEEATINPDGSTTFENGAEGGDTFDDNADDGPKGEEEFEGEATPETPGGIDPAIYLILIVIAIAVIWIFFWFRRRKESEVSDAFFSDLDGEKFNLKLPAAVEEYYEIKAKCEKAGWEPGQAPSDGQPPKSGPHRVLAQALMKRAIADIPIVQHIQKESAGMNRLYSQSMCSVKQWKAYQAAENMVSAEVEEVREEADQIEPGWSQAIWKQAMQYHNMLKQKHEMEAKKQADEAEKRRVEEAKKSAEKKKVDDAKARELAAEKAAAELIKMEEREKESKTSFSKDTTLKKGFLDKPKKKTSVKKVATPAD